jgi:hypothetical protein
LPWKYAGEADWRCRVSQLYAPNVKALNELVDAIRQETRAHVPWVDPFCGGVDAKLLLVFLRPGPRGAMATNFLSLANGDETARNTITLLQEAGLKYSDVTFWNAVPWSGPREEPISTGMLQHGGLFLRRMLEHLASLRAIMLIGEMAKRLRQHVPQSGAEIITCAHPGPIVWRQHRYRDKREQMAAAFQRAAEAIQEPHQPSARAAGS